MIFFFLLSYLVLLSAFGLSSCKYFNHIDSCPVCILETVKILGGGGVFVFVFVFVFVLWIYCFMSFFLGPLCIA